MLARAQAAEAAPVLSSRSSRSTAPRNRDESLAKMRKSGGAVPGSRTASDALARSERQPTRSCTQRRSRSSTSRRRRSHGCLTLPRAFYSMVPRSPRRWRSADLNKPCCTFVRTTPTTECRCFPPTSSPRGPSRGSPACRLTARRPQVNSLRNCPRTHMTHLAKLLATLHRSAPSRDSSEPPEPSRSAGRPLSGMPSLQPLLAQPWNFSRKHESGLEGRC